MASAPSWTCMRLLALGALAGLASCMTPITDRQWVRVETENFVLYSEISEAETVTLAEKLETFREMTRTFTNAGSMAFEPVIPTIAYVFDSQRAYQRFGPPQSAGFIAPRQRANYIALNGRASGISATRIIYHEFVHYLLRSSGKVGYPRWFDEGLAEYLGATRIDEKHVNIGSIPEDRIPTLQLFQRLSLERLMTASDTSRWTEIDNAMLYAQSWALVHYLNHGGLVGMKDRQRQLGKYLRLLNEGVPTKDAFAQAFETTFGELGKELDRYVVLDKYAYRQEPRSSFPPAKVLSARPATKAEIAQQLGRLALVGGDGETARSFFETSVALEPDNARALAGLAFASWLQRVPDFDVGGMLERAAELDPQDALNHLDRAEYLLAQAAANAERPEYLSMLDDARSAFVKALELDPDLPEAYARAATLYQLPGQDWRKGKPLIEQAHALLPTDVAIATSLADFYVLDGAHERAEELLDTAAQWAAESGGEQARAIESVRSRLAEARAKAGTSPSATGGDGGNP